MIRVCAFDLGNTLCNDTLLYDTALEIVSLSFQERGLVEDAGLFVEVFDAVNRKTELPFVSHTFGEARMFEETFEELGVVGVTAKEGLDYYRETVIAQTKLDSQIRAGLNSILEQGIRIALLSNERRARVDGWFAATKTRALFDVVCVSEDVGYEKPDPGFFSQALSLIGHPAEEVVMFGDNTISDGGCQDLGIPFVHVTAFSSLRWYFERGIDRKPDYVLPEISAPGLAKCLIDLSENLHRS